MKIGPMTPAESPTIFLIQNLALGRCPHCGVARPLLSKVAGFGTQDSNGRRRWWGTYVCSVCGGVVTAASLSENGRVGEFYPRVEPIDLTIPERPRAFLKQASESLAQPSGAIMLCASAIDAMLKERKLTKGSLYERIDLAATRHLITDGMARWAHQVRLDANDQRHADGATPLPTHEDAKRCLEFAMALAEFFFVLPARVTRGIKEATPEKKA